MEYRKGIGGKNLAKRLPTRKLLKEEIEACLPDFVMQDDKKLSGYWIKRTRLLKKLDIDIHDYIQMHSSQKEKNYQINIASTCFNMWNGQFGGRSLGSSTGLHNLRLNSSATDIEETFYNHDGTEEGARKTLYRIKKEIEKYALNFFTNQSKRIDNNPITLFGLKWIKTNSRDIPKNIHEVLLNESYTLTSIKNPLFVRFANEIIGEAKRMKYPLRPGYTNFGVVPRTMAYDLLLYASENGICGREHKIEKQNIVPPI